MGGVIQGWSFTEKVVSLAFVRLIVWLGDSHLTLVFHFCVLINGNTVFSYYLAGSSTF